jgi:hypothetical protein
MAPTVGFLWTPGYWGWGGGIYVWHPGYWGPHVGFYGGINYGFGYVGVGYAGGYWNHGVFAYNRTVNNINVTNIHNTYNTTVVNNVTVNRVSYNGGTGGTTAQPTAAEMSAAHEQHIQPTAEQSQHEQGAGNNRALLASVNHGSPTIAATSKPGEFSRGVVPASRPSTKPGNVANNGNNPEGAVHPNSAMNPKNTPVSASAHPKNQGAQHQNRNVGHPKENRGNGELRGGGERRD